MPIATKPSRSRIPIRKRTVMRTPCGSTGRYEQPLSDHMQLAVRPVLATRAWISCSTSSSASRWSENGQESVGADVRSTFTAFNDTSQFLTGVDVEFAQGFLKETQAGPATDGAPGRECHSARRQALRLSSGQSRRRCLRTGRATVRRALESDWRRALRVCRLRIRQPHDQRQHRRERRDLPGRLPVQSPGGSQRRFQQRDCQAGPQLRDHRRSHVVCHRPLAAIGRRTPASCIDCSVSSRSRISIRNASTASSSAHAASSGR